MPSISWEDTYRSYVVRAIPDDNIVVDKDSRDLWATESGIKGCRDGTAAGISHPHRLASALVPEQIKAAGAAPRIAVCLYHAKLHYTWDLAEGDEFRHGYGYSWPTSCFGLEA